jgi:tetratricopeptide (TPR) repeat protein
MQSLVTRALVHTKENPLLAVFQTEVDFYQINRCECGDARQVALYTALFGRPSTSAHLWTAGDAAADARVTPVALVLLSETLRFNPWATRGRMQRSMSLTQFGDAQWALRDADQSIKEDPGDAAGYRARALALESMNEYPHAAEALKAALARDAGDAWSLVELGNIYASHTREWDKAWAISDEATREFPDVPYGWILRAKVQMEQPHPGLKSTYQEFSRRFGNDPAQQEAVAQMRAALTAQGR